jgi:ABC-2 type transport system permease protein/lipopolysaccharide transport system permease protein
VNGPHTADLLEPLPEQRFRRTLDVGGAMRELWRSRELISTLGERDLRVRYKQAFLGAAWALLTPIALMIVFTVFLQRVADIETGGVPYPVFAYVGLIPWGFFSTSVSLGGQSLVANNPLLNKVYCPREVFPLASMFVAAADMVLSSLVLIPLFAITDFWPRITSVWIPLLFAPP